MTQFRKLGMSENKPEPVLQSSFVIRCRICTCITLSLPVLNVLCRQNHCKKHTSSLSLCFSFFHTGDTVFEVLQEAQRDFTTLTLHLYYEMYNVLCWFIILFHLLSIIVTFYSKFQTVITPQPSKIGHMFT